MITVIIPTYNRGSLLKRAVDSVLNQTYKNIEIIVVDDCSTDNTEKIMKDYNQISFIKYIKLTKNSGACVARNVGIKNAKGNIIAFLDSDDEWLNDKLEKQYNYMIKNNVSVVTCNYLYEKNNNYKIAIKNQNKVITYEQLLYKNYVGIVFIAKKEVFSIVGDFLVDMPRYQDWELALRIAKKFDIHFLNEKLVIAHVQTKSISSSTSKEKKYIALEKIYLKNKEAYETNKKAKAHVFWSMGMYSLYFDKPKINYLKKGIILDKNLLKRLIVLIMIKIGLKTKVMKLYEKSH